ncbi:hypothetical protein H0H92_014801 [Tricholoma furcatifolium]|nr:hypothetical protein H0H92_014801 [Tricholoma furcatifolium]
MGNSAKAVFSYGFIMDAEKLHALHAQLLLRDKTIESMEQYDPDDYENFQPQEAISQWLESAHFEPFCYGVETKYVENEVFDQEMVIYFVNTDEEEFGENEIEVWGCPPTGTLFQTTELPSNKAFLDKAKDAFKKLTENKVFRAAGITKIQPKWILQLVAD